MNPPKTVKEVRKLLTRTENGGIKNTIDNCIIILQQDPVLRGGICNNLLTERIDIVKDMGWKKDFPNINDTDYNYLIYYFEKNYGIVSDTRIQRAISIVADKHRYHPIRDYLNGLNWDGKERIRYVLHHFLGADVSDFNYEIMRIFMMGAIKRVFEPGCKFEVMLCLVGGQGAGKSTFFRFLAVKDEWFSDDLRKIDDDNVYRKLQGHWIIEMSEMIATANAKSIEEIKAFLSRPKETYKVPYAIHPQDKLRQCVFGGTSNALDFLPLDRSGNRRFLPVMVYPERAEVHILEDEVASRAYMDQLWAEAMVLYRQGPGRLTLSKEMEQQLVEMQKMFMPEDTKTGYILDYLDRFTGTQVCTKQLYREALNHPFDDPKSWEIREINEIMNTAVEGWKAFSNPRHFDRYGRQRGWERDNEQPTTKDDFPDNFQEIPDAVAEQLEIPFCK